jgi:uncharacterized protein YjbJ (UPF0337 family)
MNKDILKGNWKQLKGEVQKRWGEFTNDAVDQIEGDYEKLVGSVQKTYGIARDEAEKQVKEWNDKSKAA